ncbi:hypothetical protein BRDID11002_59460 [Bradyrhizobium diazoefficiens]|uniref:Uncharacterized protein n=1 Tax=Bradyrhizobium diazoefficiens TaxID=1355477 RepID=A0A809WSN0_9BRAD|nr:hypothetical protein XF1B_04860 [Bradyrhizobium diazoefficiens]BCF22533.1 hypothetical protein XF14B_04850 [Bradyrhizobium diazoefficiens]
MNQVVDPWALDFCNVEDRKAGAIILKPKTLARSPDGDEIVEVIDVRSARNGKPKKTYVPLFAGAREHKYRRNGATSRIAAMKTFEEATEELVAETAGFMQAASRLLVVAEVDEGTGFPVERVGPIRIVKRCLQNNKCRIIEAAAISKPALI